MTEHKDNGLGDKIKGTISKIKGEAKDQYGNATNNASLQAEGKVDKAKGEVQQKVGEAKDHHNH
ncbi:CsbD family protein [Paenibacillus wenxiniae]|uniref:CsbD family protein n=1 Tax=Paenibacillus wenxiniae TaxID=1636843 RepID=A0ABW4RNA9_9BACL